MKLNYCFFFFISVVQVDFKIVLSLTISLNSLRHYASIVNIWSLENLIYFKEIANKKPFIPFSKSLCKALQNDCIYNWKTVSIWKQLKQIKSGTLVCYPIVHLVLQTLNISSLCVWKKLKCRVNMKARRSYPTNCFTLNTGPISCHYVWNYHSAHP